MLGAAQAVLLGAAGCVQRGYDATVAGIPGLVAYWRFSDASGVIDATAGGRHGTYDGAVSLVPGLPADSDAATHLPGNVVGTVPHDPGLLLPAFTLSLWVELVEEPTDPNWFCITKDRSGLFDGDFAVMFTAELELNARFQTAEEGSAPGATFQAQVGVPYHVVVTAGAHGLSMWVDGKLIDADDTYTGGWSENTEPIRFARGIANDFLANIILDEVALYSRVLADSEIIALSQRTSPPVALGDAFPVTGATTGIFDILANDSWVGRHENLVVDIVSPPSFGAITVRSDKTIEFAAYPVEQDVADSFAYRLTDAMGQSNIATANVAVQHIEAPPASPIYQCYAESNADTVVVSSAAALANAVNNAPPGRNILVAPGNYSGGTQTLSGHGTAASSVVVRPQNGIGTVTFTGANWTISGTRLVLSKLYFVNGAINFNNSSFNRITRCRFTDQATHAIRLLACTDTRVDHCDFSDWRNTTANKSTVRWERANVANGTLKRTLMDYCYIHDISTTQGSNGSDIVGASGSTNAFDKNPEAIVDHCLFRNIGPVPNEGEVFGAKFSNCGVRFCTFEGITSMYINLPRMATAWELRSCWIESNNRNPLIMVRADDALVIGNRFVGGQHLDVASGTRYWDGTPGLGGDYHACRNGRIIGNILATGSIRVGQYWSGSTPTARALNNVLEANIRNGDLATTGNGVNLTFETGTAVSATTAEVFTPAVKLTPADVGLNAPDPPCSLA